MNNNINFYSPHSWNPDQCAKNTHLKKELVTPEWHCPGSQWHWPTGTAHKLDKSHSVRICSVKRRPAQYWEEEEDSLTQQMIESWQNRGPRSSFSAISSVTHFSRLWREGSPSFVSDGIYNWGFPKQTCFVTSRTCVAFITCWNFSQGSITYFWSDDLSDDIC